MLALVMQQDNNNYRVHDKTDKTDAVEEVSVVYVNKADGSIAFTRHGTKESLARDKTATMVLPGTKRVFVEKGASELNPDEVDIVEAVWDDERQQIVHEDDAQKGVSEEDIANRTFSKEFEKCKSDAKRVRMIRFERDARLAFLDRMTCNPMRWDEEFNEREKDEMREYRRELLDITRQPDFPRVVEFPAMPDVVRSEFQKP